MASSYEYIIKALFPTPITKSSLPLYKKNKTKQKNRLRLFS